MGGADYFGALAPYFLKMTYTDNCDGEKADDLQIELADRDRRFINDWMPDTGASLTAAIICERWFAPLGSTLRLNCGTFWIDSVEFDLPAHTVKICATSVPTDSHIKTSNVSRPFENTTLRDVATQVLGDSDMGLDYRADFNPTYVFVEQVEESGLHFLKSRCDDAKLGMKVVGGNVIIYDSQKLEEESAAFTIVYGDGAGGGNATYRMSGGRFYLRVSDATKTSDIANTDIDSGLTNQQQFTASDDLPSAWKDHINWNTDWLWKGTGVAPPSGGGKDPSTGGLDSYSDESGDNIKAMAHTRDKNKHKFQIEIEMSIGNPLIAAGQTFTLSGCGQFDGDYFIESARHTVEDQYNTMLLVRRCLEGY